MNAKLENKLSMYLAVQLVLDRNKTTWQGLTALADAVTEFNQHVANIPPLAQTQSTPSAGITADKAQLRAAMAQAALEVAAATHAYAKKAKNNDLAAKTKVALSHFTQGRDTVAADRARVVHAAAASVVASLAPYGVTAAKLTALAAKIDAYAASLGKPRDAVASSSTATRLLKAEFTAADALLRDQLDALVPQFAAANARFVQDYQNARIIVDSRGGPGTPPPPPATTPPPSA